MKLHTWELTVSTKGDIDDDCVGGIVAYFKKKCRYGFVVLEYAAKWHLHAVVCFKQPIEKKHIEETVWEKVKKYHPDSIKTKALKTVVQYDHDWRSNYLQKDEHKKVLWDHYHEEDYTKFFPSKEEQEKLIKAKESRTMAASDHKSPVFQRYLQMWTNYSTQDTYEAAVEWFKYAMYVECSIPIMVDQRRMRQNAWALHEFRTKNTKVTAEDRTWLGPR